MIKIITDATNDLSAEYLKKKQDLHLPNTQRITEFIKYKNTSILYV